LKHATCCNEKQENAPRQSHRDFVAQMIQHPPQITGIQNDFG